MTHVQRCAADALIQFKILLKFEHPVAAAKIFWESHFQNISADSVTGLMAVVANKRDQAFTCQVDGKHASFFGMSDACDLKFDDIVLEAEHSSSLRSDEGKDARAHHGIQLDASFVSCNVRACASVDMQASCSTNKPVVHTIAVAVRTPCSEKKFKTNGRDKNCKQLDASNMLFICPPSSSKVLFLLTAFVFTMHDRLVERRQRKIHKTALKSAQSSHPISVS